MSRPYININSMSYTAPVLTMNWTYYKTRGGGDYTITGFSNSISFSDSNANNPSETLTFSVPGALGYPTNPLSTFSDPSISFTVTGTASTYNNAKVFINGVTISSTTASTSALTTWLNAIANDFYNSSVSHASFPIGVWTSSVTMTSATAGTIAFVPSASGNYYNTNYNLTCVGLAASYSSISAAVVGSNTFSGGTTNYALTLSFPKLGGIGISSNNL